MKNNSLQLYSFLKKGTPLIFGLGLLLGNISTQAATDCNAVTEISKIECESLLELYHSTNVSTNGAEWYSNKGWNVTNTPCNWYGITCENGGVIEINLTNRFSFYLYLGVLSHDSLYGTLPNFKGLPNLRRLDLSYHHLKGVIPDFSGLPKLQTLNLSINQLTGMIPDFSGFPKLQTLDLSINQLTGMIPDFSGLPELQKLNLKSNQLTGAIPDFSTLPNLQSLNLSNNNLINAIPNFSALPNLQTLALSNNQLTDVIPNFSALPQLQVLDLHFNNLTGAIPDFSNFPQLEKLELSDNQLIGTLPNFNALPKLKYFQSGGNQLTLIDTNCNIVTQISKVECESLLEFYYSTNGAEWKHNSGWNVTNLPCSWYGITCENSGVIRINIHFNNLTGAMPDLSTLPNLQWLNLSSNQLMGEIPDLSALPNLNYLNLSSNLLTGVIPNFSALPNLQWLNLSYNQLIGEIPDFSALLNLEEFYFRENQLCKNSNINYSAWQEKANAFPTCPAATVKMQLNESRYTTGNPLRIEMQVNGEAKADLYVAIVFPDGDLMTIAYPLFFSWLNAVQIYLPAVDIAGLKTYPIMDFPLPAGITTGNYHACGVLVLAGEYHSEDNWIDKHCVGFEVY